MRIKKKFLLVIASLTMLLFPFLSGHLQTVSAAESEQTVVIHNLKYDKLPGEIQNTGDEMTDFTGTPIEGSIFTAYDVTSVYWTAYNGAEGEHAAKEKAGIAAAEAAETTGMTEFVFAPTGADGLAERKLPIKSGEDNAIYLIKQTGFPAGIVQSKSTPFVIGLPSHDKDGNLREKVHVYPKNEFETNSLKFIKYGVNEDGSPSVLQGAKFILEHGEKGVFYNSSTNEFDLDKDAATENSFFTSDKDGVVEMKDLTLSEGTYRFHEIESDVSTSKEQPEPGDPDPGQKFHFAINPKVIVHIDKDMEVTQYDYYDQNLVKQTITAPFDETKVAKAYNFKVPKIKKEVDDEEVRNGQVVRYTIRKKIPEDVGNYTKYELIDTFDDRLELCCDEAAIKGSIKVDGAKTDLKPTYSNGGQSFTLAFNPQNLVEHAKKELSFEATMKIKAGIELKEIDNDVKFDNNFRDSKDKQQVETYAKRFVKVDSKTDKKMKGAEFVIKNNDNEFMKLTKENDGSFVESVTGYAKDYVVSWSANEKDATKLVSDDEGKFGIYGLGVKDKDYYTLIENKAPDGYVKLKDLKFTADGAEDSQILKVENKAKGILPMTGGMGLVSLLFIGVVGLVGGLAYFKKRRIAKS